jgi:D-glycero-D-manno-heptose 1,7-bisphosphate phosphatase
MSDQVSGLRPAGATDLGRGMQRAIFLDRDGVINYNRPGHIKSLAEFILLPGALQALRLLTCTGMRMVVISNQSAINRGLVSQGTVEEIHRHLVEWTRAAGGWIDAVCYCPHRPDEGCKCRKPRPGMLVAAARRLNIDLTRSYLVGDAVSDVQAALAVGAQPLMVLTGQGRAQAPMLSSAGLPHIPLFRDLLEAAGWILEQEGLSDFQAGSATAYPAAGGSSSVTGCQSL